MARIEIYPNKERSEIIVVRNGVEAARLSTAYIDTLQRGYQPHLNENLSLNDLSLFDLQLALVLPYVYENDLAQVTTSNIIDMQGNTFTTLKAVLIDVFQKAQLKGINEMQEYSFYRLLFEHLLKERLHAVYSSE